MREEVTTADTQGRQMENDAVTPASIVNTAFAMVQTKVLGTAVDLNLFGIIAEGRDTTSAIAASAGISQRAAGSVLKALTAMGFLQRKDDTFILADGTRSYLVPGAEEYMGDYVVESGSIWEDLGELTEVIQSGNNIEDDDEEELDEYFKGIVEGLFVENYQVANAAAEHLEIGKTRKDLRILDVAAGSCVWSVPMAQLDPGSHVDAMDFPAVVDYAVEFTERHGVTDQFTFLPGDLEDYDFGEDIYDLVIIGHICHGLGEERSRALMAQAHRALKDSGELLLADQIMNDEKTGPLFPTLLGVHLLLYTDEGKVFSLGEFERWMKQAGFDNIESFSIPPHTPFLLGTKG
jgi:SAM-dependent methyltransferase